MYNDVWGCAEILPKGVIKSPEEIKETVALRALAADISEGAEHVKRSRSKNTRAACQ